MNTEKLAKEYCKLKGIDPDCDTWRMSITGDNIIPAWKVYAEKFELLIDMLDILERQK